MKIKILKWYRPIQNLTRVILIRLVAELKPVFWLYCKQQQQPAL